LFANSTGYNNIASGFKTLYSNTTGSSNVAYGSDALYSNTTGYNNLAYGIGALYSNTTGSSNIAIGHEANVGSANLTNAITIGYAAIVDASNKIRLGNTNVTVIEGQVAFSNASDRRLKKDIVDTRYGLNTILELRPVDYQMKSNNLEQIGFIAQELRPIVPEAVSGIEGDLEKGETLGVAYTTLIPVLTKAIQEQQALIEAQNKVIQQLQKDMEILKQKVAKD
jgi:trimeric autotransporter adhesin